MDGTLCPPGTVAAVGVLIEPPLPPDPDASVAPLFGLVRTLRPLLWLLIIIAPSRGEFSSEALVAPPVMATVSTVLVRCGPGGREVAARAAGACRPVPGPEPRSGLFSLLPSASASAPVAAAMLRVTTPGDDAEDDASSLFDGESAEEEGGTRASLSFVPVITILGVVSAGNRPS